MNNSSGSGDRVGAGEKHEIYVAVFGGHLFYNLFLQGQGGGMAPLARPLDQLLNKVIKYQAKEFLSSGPGVYIFSNTFFSMQRRIQIVKFLNLPDPIFLIFIQFLGTFVQIIGRRPVPCRFAPPSRKSWIRPCLLIDFSNIHFSD